MKKPGYLIALLALLVAFSAMPACSTSRTTTTTTTTKKADQSAPESTTTTVTTDEPDSVLGATLHAVGTIVLFPFRLVGDAIGLLV